MINHELLSNKKPVTKLVYKKSFSGLFCLCCNLVMFIDKQQNHFCPKCRVRIGVLQ